MNKTRNNSLRACLTALCAAAFCLLGTQTAWGQTTQGVKVGSADVKKVNDVDVNNGDIKEATSGSPVKVTVTDKTGGATPQVAKVTVVRYDQVKVTGITVKSAGDVTEMNGNAQLQMSPTIVTTYADNKTVTWSVASATGSSATATIDASTGLLRAGTVQGDVIVTARATNGTEDVTDDVVNTKTITITTIPLTADNTTITVAAATYTGSALTPTVTVKYGGTTLTQGTDYTIDLWSNNKNAGTASVTVTGMGAYSGSIVKNFTINKANWTGTVTVTLQGISYKATYHRTGQHIAGEIKEWNASNVNYGYWGIISGTSDTSQQNEGTPYWRVILKEDSNHNETIIYGQYEGS